MKEKLLVALKTKFKNLGFGDKAFDGVADYLSKTVTEESQIETAIGGVEPLLKSFQGDIDKVRNEKTELQRKYDELNKNNPNPPEPRTPPANDPNDIKSIVAAVVAEAITPLKSELDTYKKKDVQTGYFSKVKTALSEKKVPESFWSKRALVVESDEQLNTVISEIETDWTSFRQEQINAGVMIDKPAAGSPENSDVKSIVNQIEAGTKAIVESKSKTV